MNVRAHRFDVAVLNRNRFQAEVWFRELERDSWMRSSPGSRFDLYLGRLKLVQGDFVRAAQVFESHLNPGDSPVPQTEQQTARSAGEPASLGAALPPRVAQTEQEASRMYWELGRARRGQGDGRGAGQAWHDGRRLCPDELGYRPWKQRIRRALRGVNQDG